MESEHLSMLEIIQGIESLLKDKYGLIVSTFKKREHFDIYMSSYLNEEKVKSGVESTIKSYFNKQLDCNKAQVERTAYGYKVTFGDEEAEAKLLETTQSDAIGTVKTYKCHICGSRGKGYGHNPWPVSTDPNHRACDACNTKHVIPARLKQLLGDQAKTEAIEKSSVEKDASNKVLDDKFIWLFSVIAEDGTDIEEGIDVLEDAIDILVEQKGTFLVAYPYVDPNPEDPNVEIVFADNPGPVIIYNHEKANARKAGLEKPTVASKTKEGNA
jgi:hypothetical protein